MASGGGATTTSGAAKAARPLGAWTQLDERLFDAHWRRDRGFVGVGALSRRLLHYGYGDTAVEFRLLPQRGRRVHARFFAPTQFALANAGPLPAVDGAASIMFNEALLEVDAAVAVSQQDQVDISLLGGDLDELGVLGGVRCQLRALSPMRSRVQGVLHIHSEPVTVTAVLDPGAPWRAGVKSELRAGPVRASATVVASPTAFAVPKAGIAFTHEFLQKDKLPARYEVAAVRRPESITCSFYYQSLYGWRLVSLGGEAAFVRRPTPTAPDASKVVLCIGGMWQTSRHTAIKARVTSEGDVGAVYALRTRSHPALALLVSTDLSLVNTQAMRFGVSLQITQV